MSHRRVVLALLVMAVCIFPVAMMANTIAGNGSLSTNNASSVAWSPSDAGGTYFSNVSADGSMRNVGWCIAGGGNCNFAGQPGTALPFYQNGTGGAVTDIHFVPSGTTLSATLQIEIAGLAATNSFGYYLLSNPGTLIPLISGSSPLGTTVFFTPAGAYGLYLQNTTTGALYLSQALAAGDTDPGNQHFAVFGTGTSGPFWVGMEDLPFSVSDQDFNDMLVSISEVPEPGSMALLGSSLLGLAGLLRRKFRV